MEGEHIFEVDDYESINFSITGLITGEGNFIANMANAASVLWYSLSNINWVGFYLEDPVKDNLVLGPFQGKPACVRIEYGRGVCGSAVSLKAVQRIGDVHTFPGHIACDSASVSEIVIPLIVGGRVMGVLDIDSPIKDRFSHNDQVELEKLVSIILDNSDL